MIFITVGSQKFQFNRLLKDMDKLVEFGVIEEKIFAQIGYSDYKPKNYKFKEFLSRDEFNNIMSNSSKVITHGGTGAILGAIKSGKKVIAVPRLKVLGEHVDDHQIDIVGEFKKMGYIDCANTISELELIIRNIDKATFKQYTSNTNSIIKSIDQFINSI